MKDRRYWLHLALGGWIEEGLARVQLWDKDGVQLTNSDNQLA